MPLIDASTEAGKHVQSRLEEELVIWLTTGGSKPQSVPVWFLWDGESFLVYSVPGRKVTQLERNPDVRLNFNSTQTGGDVVRFRGRAKVVPEEPPAHENADYVRKYVNQISRLGWTPEQFAEQYSVAIRITPERLFAE
jgi:PPOX class probable F420-dependent enzyme